MKKQKGSACRIVSPATPDYSARAAAVIRAGGVVATATETFYGLAVDPFNQAALKRLFSLKQRRPDNPILVLINDLQQVRQLAAETPFCYLPVIKKSWPGPLTLIFPALPHLSPLLTGGSGTIGIRHSSSRIAAAIIREAGGPITATSANISGSPPARSAQEVLEIFGDTIDLVVDGGRSSSQSGSTVVREERGALVLVRAGLVDFASLAFL